MASKKTSYKLKKSDNFLMLLAAVAALVVGFFAISMYKSPFVSTLPGSAPSPTVMVMLNKQNGSGETGTATFWEANGKTVVTLNLVGFPQGVSQPAHIHIGSCPNPGAVKYPLTSVVDGKSSTVLNVTFDQLRALGPIAVNVHKSVAQISVYYSCGDINL